VPEIVTTVGTETGDVVIEKGGPLVAPAGTVVVAGVWATAGFELVMVTTAPPAGAGLSRITLLEPVELPPTTVFGFAWICAIAVGLIVRFRTRDPPLYVAVIATTVVDATGVDTMMKSGDFVWFAATVTEAGTDAMDGFELVRPTTAPPGGAGPFRVTLLLVVVLPPPKVFGFRKRMVTWTGLMVRDAVRVTPPKEAEMVTVVAAETPDAPIENGALVEPCGIATDEGTDATAGSELVRVTIAPPAGAGPFSDTEFAVKEAGPITDEGETPRDESERLPMLRTALTDVPL
jgi:hypothetical protein